MSLTALQHAQHLLDFIEDSPTPWHTVARMEHRLLDSGFTRLNEVDRWKLLPGGRYFVTRGGASLIAFVIGREPMLARGLRLIGAHTDSPGLRLKPRPAEDYAGLVRLGVEVYGGPILATYADRDLSLAGRVTVRSIDGFTTHLVRFNEPLVRLPNLAIHMNRDVNEAGLKFNKQNELPLLLGLSEPGIPAEGRFRQLIAEQLEIDAPELLTWELAAYDTQKGRFWGDERNFIASRQLDNLASCHAALTALCAADNPASTLIAAFFDHEEVGSESSHGAASSFVSDLIARLAASQSFDTEDARRLLAKSFFISADMAHAWQPNFPGAYEPNHRLTVNGGPAIKINANQRYCTQADTAARFIGYCESAGVPWQSYNHRADLACGSTIGPILAARLGIPGVDVGTPLWAMHSIRESAGVDDHAYLIAALSSALAD